MIRTSLKRISAPALAVALAMAAAGCSSGAGSVTGTPSTPGTISFATTSTMITQATGATATIAVARTAGSSGAASIAYATSNGTAFSASDFTATSGTITWPDGDSTSRNIVVPISAATAFFGTRTFNVTLATPTGAALGTQATNLVTITGSLLASPSPGTLAFSSATTTAAQAAGNILIPVNRSSGSSGAISVAYATSNGTAISSTDYTATTGTLSWANAETTSKNISVPINAASQFAGTKTFNITLSAPTGGAALGSPAIEQVSLTGNLIPPSSLSQFNFAPYKLTLPIDQYGGTGGLNNDQYEAATITTSQLQSGFADPYFYADPTGNVVFTTPSNGASTSPGSGSDHTRSELRELYTGTGHDSNSDWNSAIGGTLTATCQVQAVSVNSDEATIGQIHNQTYVFMLLIYRPAKQDVQMVVYNTYGSSATTRYPILTNVKLNDTLSYKIVYKNNSIAATVNGTTVTAPVDSSWAGTPTYFKLGAYHAAPNIGNPDGDYTRVSFSTFAITHP